MFLIVMALGLFASGKHTSLLAKSVTKRFYNDGLEEASQISISLFYSFIS